MNATADLFEDHSTEQAATAGALNGRGPVGGRDAAPPVSAAVVHKDSAPLVPEAERPGGDAGADQIAAQGLCDERRSQTPAALNTCGSCREWSERPSGFGDCTWLPSWTTTSPHATCHFTEASRWQPIDSATIAKRAAQRGIDQAVGAADRAAPGWSTRALEFIRLFAAANAGRQLTGYEIVQESISRGFEQPKNGGQAWGSPLQRAARAGHLVRRGSVPDPNPERHGSDVPLWECA